MDNQDVYKALSMMTLDARWEREAGALYAIGEDYVRQGNLEQALLTHWKAGIHFLWPPSKNRIVDLLEREYFGGWEKNKDTILPIRINYQEDKVLLRWLKEKADKWVMKVTALEAAKALKAEVRDRAPSDSSASSHDTPSHSIAEADAEVQAALAQLAQKEGVRQRHTATGTAPAAAAEG